MTKKFHFEKKTKIYIPKTVNPQIISYRSQSENNAEIKSNDTIKKTF